MTDRLLDTYIKVKLLHGGKKDIKAAGYARQLSDMFGDEPIPDRSTCFDGSEIKDTLVFEKRDGKLAAKLEYPSKALSPVELRFIYPLVDLQGRFIPDDYMSRVVDPNNPISRNYIRSLYERVKRKVEDDPNNPSHILRLNSRGTVGIGLDRQSFMDFVDKNRAMFHLPSNVSHS